MTPAPREIDEKVLQLAAAALRESVHGQTDQAAVVIAWLYERHGWDGLGLAMLYWCDALGEHMCDGPMGNRKATGLHIVDADTGGLISADDDMMPPAARWAARMIEARMTMDRAGWKQGMDALPTDEAEIGEHVMMLLVLIGWSIAGMPRGMGLTAAEIVARKVASGEW